METVHTLSVHEVIDQDIMVTQVIDRVVTERFLLVGTDSHVLLAQGVDMGVDVLGELERSGVSRGPFHNYEHIEPSGAREQVTQGLGLTSCSSRGSLLSFSLCTSAEAQPTSTEAVSKETDFIMNDKGPRRREDDPKGTEQQLGSVLWDRDGGGDEDRTVDEKGEMKRNR